MVLKRRRASRLRLRRERISSIRRRERALSGPEVEASCLGKGRRAPSSSRTLRLELHVKGGDASSQTRRGCYVLGCGSASSRQWRERFGQDEKEREARRRRGRSVTSDSAGTISKGGRKPVVSAKAGGALRLGEGGRDSAQRRRRTQGREPVVGLSDLGGSHSLDVDGGRRGGGARLRVGGSAPRHRPQKREHVLLRLNLENESALSRRRAGGLACVVEGALCPVKGGSLSSRPA